jgi:phenol/toluene 2-monooxygenase (NADH) P4/A4
MTIRALGAYDFPARDRQELFGDDQLVNVFWEGNTFIVGPGCFRVPRSMTWADFRSQVMDPWASADPDYQPDKAVDFRNDDEAMNPKPTQTIEQLGIPHKGLIKFRLA